ncbi:MAG: glycine--tRNA ligase subunit beta [Casimicrobiaceae bacterium]
MADTLVVELLTEELPPKALPRLGEAFAAGIEAGLRERGFLEPASRTTGYATPRRLAVSITHVLAVAPDSEVIDKLMPAKVARDALGQPSEALKKKLAGLGRAHLATASLDAAEGPDRVYVASDGKADYVYLRSLAKGQPLQRGLDESLADAIDHLPIPKLMSYQRPDGTTVKFARPVHKLLALHGATVMPVQVLGLVAGDLTDGHRFLSRTDIKIEDAAAYAPTLEATGKVCPSFAARRARIVAALEHAAEHATVIMPDALLDEVTALVEWPAVYAGTFDRAFLDVPQECLILTMQQNQKYFALADRDGRLRHRFLLVSNIETADPAAIIQGNERVLRARLADAKFFYDQDRKTPLAARVGALANVTYHNMLGSVYERVVRIEGIAAELAKRLGVDVSHSERAARLCKADLVTDMVGEFPELQGVMGRYYALHDGEATQVAGAIEQHYWPRFAGDAVPTEGVSQVVALADKLEALTGNFGINQMPTGDKDPFALRRAAVGILRILIEQRRHLGLREAVALAVSWFESETPGKEWSHELRRQRSAHQASSGGLVATLTVTRRFPEHATALLLDFLYERLRGYLRERGYTANQVAAVVDSRPDRIDDLPDRLEAVRAFEALPEALSLSAANKRIVNILRKAAGETGGVVDRSALADGAENDLHAAFDELRPLVEARVAEGDFAAALRALASAKAAIDRFFDDVMVMTDDPSIRANRLALLREVAATMNHVADISKLAV